ncbi:MAG TPA: O-antigen ligase family protein [Verrucomicrobiae bacterium]|nr:O-antigen ligase family protein [Verrucomicrobiae bacterium]
MLEEVRRDELPGTSSPEGNGRVSPACKLGQGLLLAFAAGYPLVTWSGWIASTHAKSWVLAGFTTLIGILLLNHVWRVPSPRLVSKRMQWIPLVWVFLSVYTCFLLGPSLDAFGFTFVTFVWSQLVIRHSTWAGNLPKSVLHLLLWFSAVAWVCTFATKYQYVALSGNHYGKTGFVSLGCCTLVFVAVVLWFRQVSDVKRAMVWMVRGGAVACLLGLWQFFDQKGLATRLFPDLLKDPRSMGTSGHANWFSTYLLLLFPLATCCFLSVRRPLWLAACGLIYANILTAQTRGAWVALASFLVIAVFTQKEFRKRMLLLGLVMALVTAALAPLHNWQLLKRANSLKDQASLAAAGASHAGTGRLGFWKYAVNRLPRHAVIGSGLDTYAEVAPAGTKAPNTKAHSIYFEYALCLGIPGLVLYLGFLWRCAGGTAHSLLSWTLKATIATYLVQGVFIHDTLHSWPLVWLIAALAVVLRRNDIPTVDAHSVRPPGS